MKITLSMTSKHRVFCILLGCEGGDSCCVNGNCGLNEGDCDRDSDCQAGLVCGTNNCHDPYDTFN